MKSCEKPVEITVATLRKFFLSRKIVFVTRGEPNMHSLLKLLTAKLN